ncbi:hypothetical protein SAMN05720469_1793, partial [Fibrobacter intestinalis]
MFVELVRKNLCPDILSGMMLLALLAPADSLKTLRTETAYDLGGKPLSTTRYPYGS